jgi:hypothetical protein
VQAVLRHVFRERYDSQMWRGRRDGNSGPCIGHDNMRVKTEFWVKAYLRTRQAAGAFAAIVAHGHDDAGAVLIKISTLDGHAALYGPAPVSFSDATGAGNDRRFTRLHDGDFLAERAVDELIARQRSYDEDVWVIEVEDRLGRTGLDGWLATPS